MQRRYFLKSGVALAVAAELGASKAHGLVRAHNWDKYDFGSGPNVTDPLNQGPFSQYAPVCHSDRRSGDDHHSMPFTSSSVIRFAGVVNRS